MATIENMKEKVFPQEKTWFARTKKIPNLPGSPLLNLYQNIEEQGTAIQNFKIKTCSHLSTAKNVFPSVLQPLEND